MTEIEKKLRDISPDGYIWLNIRSKHTEHNEDIQNSFKNYAKEVCEDNYTMALERLLNATLSDAKTELLWNAIEQIHQRIDALEASLSKDEEEKEKPKSKAF